jgi:hypothetical protein
MKKITLSCLVTFFALVTQAQNPVPPTYKIDSQNINIKKVYVNPDNISQISVEKGKLSDLSNSGTIYLTLKQSYSSFLTIGDIVRRKDPGFSETKVLYIVNDQIIKDTTGIRIDPTFILNVHAVSVTNISGLCNGQPKMGIVVIDTRPNGATPPKDSIRIRGFVRA